MKRARLIYMLGVGLAAVVAPSSVDAAGQPWVAPGTPTSAATRLAEQLVVRMAALSAHQYVEGQLDTLLEEDAVAAKLLPKGSPARVAFLKAATVRTQQRVEPTVRSLIPQFSAAFLANMTSAQIDTSMRAFETPTGKRIVDRVVSEMMLSDGDEMNEMSDDEVRSLTDGADVAALAAFDKSGAGEALNRALSTMPESDNDMTGEIDALLIAMLTTLKTSQGTPVTTGPAGPIT